jgi:Na+-translocating ferredoxin:NAD+ oxidoreductase RnfA subunit
MIDFDPDRLRAAIGALMGAAIYGLVQFGAVALSGHQPTREEYRALALNVACATAAGVILAFALVQVLAPLIPFAPLRDAFAFGFGIGAFGWELLPLIFKALRNKAVRRVEEFGGEGK